MANPNKLFPLIVTDKLSETRAYYVDQLGCELVSDMPTYISVRFGGGDSGPELAFMTKDGFPGPSDAMKNYAGGLIVSIPTENADAKHAALAKKKLPLASEPSDRPWGWRSFGAVDPNGVMLDFFHVLDQAARTDATG